LVLAIAVIAVSAITLLLVIGAAIAPYSIVFAKKHSSGGNNNGNDQKQKDDPRNGSNTPSEQPTNSADQPPSTDGNPSPPPPIQTLLPVNPPTFKLDCSKTPNDPSCPPPKTVAVVDCIVNPTDPSCQKTPLPNVDCSKTPNDPSCQTAKTQMVPPNIDCTKIPKDPGCVTSTVELCTTVSPPPPECKPAKSTPLKQNPDDSCLFHPEQEKCGSDQYGNCPPGFLLNGKGHCVPDKKCPAGFEKQDNDETGACHPKVKDCNSSYPGNCISSPPPDLNCGGY
jgi:hypothetical protein